MDLTDDYLIKIAAGVTTTVAISLLYYIGNRVNRISKLLDKHEKVLFGDADIEEWQGVVKITISNRKYTLSDRKALIELINILKSNGTIELTEDLRDAINQLKVVE